MDNRAAKSAPVMDGHFRAFSFVDRITAVEPGVRSRGTYQIPARLAEFPSSLVAEAVGQLAAWSAMAKLDFKVRPVAGLAGKVEFLAPVRPGQTLELAAEIETAELDAVAYGGTASVDGKPVIILENCVGPMLPLEEFDDPQAVRDRFATLQNPGATPGVFGGVPTISFNRTNSEVGKSARATLQVPADAPFFTDHFPRRPVFPGTLLMNVNLQLAAALAQLPVGVTAAEVNDKLLEFDFVSRQELTPEGVALVRAAGRKRRFKEASGQSKAPPPSTSATPARA